LIKVAVTSFGEFIATVRFSPSPMPLPRQEESFAFTSGTAVSFTLVPPA
jgi:hypothetical protein